MLTKQKKQSLALLRSCHLMFITLTVNCALAQTTDVLPEAKNSNEIVDKIIAASKKEKQGNNPLNSMPNVVSVDNEKLIVPVTPDNSEDIIPLAEDNAVKDSSILNEATVETNISEVSTAVAEPPKNLNAGIESSTSTEAIDTVLESSSQLTNDNLMSFDINTSLTALNPSVSVQFKNELQQLYTQFPHKIWQSEENVKEFQRQLTLMALSGLNQQYSTWLEALNLPNLTAEDREIILSDAMIGYLNFVNNVQKNKASWLYKKNSYQLRPADNESLLSLINALNTDNLSTFLVSLKPKHNAYEPMFKVLLASLKQSEIEWPEIKATKSIKPNSTTDEIAHIEFILNYYGFLDIPAKQLNDETNTQVSNKSANIYDERLVEGVKKFQTSLGLTADGVIGPQTRHWLNTSPNQKVNLLALNIQRLRVIPSNLSTGILVNIPDYSLKFFKEGELVLDSRVIVGTNARKTPIMSNEINRVVINPPWSVPTRLAREDIAPKGIKDPHYFVRNGYSLVDLSDGQSIDVDDVLWENVDANNFPFAVRQKPGAGNSLGRYKFDMPNDEAIYLHDTPNHALFDRDVRAISSGCVRVNKSTELANLLLNLEQWDNDKVANTVKKGQTTPVKLTTKVPVELYYLTAWPNEQGQIQYRADIYGYDKIIDNAKTDVSLAHLL